LAHIIIFDEVTGTAYYPGHEGEEGEGDGEGRTAEQPDTLSVSRWIELDINPAAFDALVKQIIGKG
jgi:hypothetical protein